ncbi:hypothetical protein B0H19DRAFT_1263561 [Mycena capillaripes]|nr:hypothetical protein B0H19DRAFT_1263561 [Mycena capillaripes]
MGNTTIVGATLQVTSDEVVVTEIVLFLHGVYMTLLVLALYLLCQRKPAGWRILACLLVVMCITGTADVILQAIITKYFLRELDALVQDSASSASLHSMRHLLLFAEHSLGVTDIAIADSLLIYRCYVIWKTSRIEVVVFPILLAVATTAVGYVTAYHSYVTPSAHPADVLPYLGFVLATNVTVTGLTVGRIWYTRQGLQSLGQTKFLRRYNLAMALLFVYPVP